MFGSLMLIFSRHWRVYILYRIVSVSRWVRPTVTIWCADLLLSRFASVHHNRHHIAISSERKTLENLLTCKTFFPQFCFLIFLIFFFVVCYIHSTQENTVYILQYAYVRIMQVLVHHTKWMMLHTLTYAIDFKTRFM